MEGLAAVSLAGNILQFIHTTRQLVSVGREVFDSGTKNEYIELEFVAKEIRSQANRLKSSIQHETASAENSLQSLAVKCQDVADQLLDMLAKLKVEDNSSKWRSFLQVLRTQWHEPEIDALRARLDPIGRAVNARLAADTHFELRRVANELAVRNNDLEGPKSQTRELSDLPKKLHNALKEYQEPERDDPVLAEILNNIASSGRRISAEQQILYSLRFVRLEDRYSSISTAHRNTLKWLFGTADTQDAKTSATTFLDWLHSDQDLYWITGRPGAGKSTLMKFLCTHELTLQHLHHWAGKDQVIVAEYFFWNAGKNGLQKSQEGLLRSLLYQILRSCPSYIRAVFPDVWQVLNPDDLDVLQKTDIAPDVGLPMDVSGLMAALKRTCGLLTDADTRLCFFIDGLDEYEGDTQDVISLVGILRALKHVKICVSSREWNEFDEAYGKGDAAKLYMQHFNDADINAYIDDIFANDDNYQELEDKETRGKALVEEIVTAAKGVFLWVVLVVRSFQEGLREGDSIARLQKRLHTLPTKLEEYFERILFHDVRDAYRDQAAQMFMVTLVAKETLPLMSYWFLDEPELPTQRQPLKMQQTIKRHKDAKKRLIASCKGLLEPQYQRRAPNADSLPSAMLFEYRVDFLHRTVRDYLELPTTDIRHWAPADFDPHEAICKAIYSQIKTAPHGIEYGSHISCLFEVFEYHATVSEGRHGYDGIRALRTELVTSRSAYGVETHWDQPAKEAERDDLAIRSKIVVDEPLPIFVDSHAKPSSNGAPERKSAGMRRWTLNFSRKKSKDTTKHD